MRKILALYMALMLCLALCACEGVDLPPMPSIEPASGTVAEIPEVETDETQEPEEASQTETEEPSAQPVELGAQVMVNIGNRTETFNAPDNDQQRILTFGYDTVVVHIDGNADASEAINHSLALEDEIYYTGSGNGDGLNGLLEQATDNYSIAQQTGEEIPLELSSVRTASIPRVDSRVISVSYLTNVYTGGAHGFYYERSHVFDAQSGAELRLEDLSQDYDAFSAFLLEKMQEQAQEENSTVDLVEPEQLPEALSALLRSGSWCLDENGLVIYSDLYEISSYAAGIISFPFSYEELSPYLDAKWMPVEREGDGEVAVAYTADVDVQEMNKPILDRVAVQPEGEDLILAVNGTIYDVEIATVHYFDDGIGFYETAEHWACSYLQDSAIQLVTVIPEGMPNLMVRYSTSDGTTHKLLLSQSGEDGSLILTDSNIEAVG